MADASVEVIQGEEEEGTKEEEESMEQTESTPTKGTKRSGGKGGPPAKRRKKSSVLPKNALMRLNELKPGLKFQFESQGGPPHDPVFVMSVEVNDQKFTGKGNSKQMAKHAAAHQALGSFVQFQNMAEAPNTYALSGRNVDFTTDYMENQVPKFSNFEPPKSENGIGIADSRSLSEVKFASKLRKIANEAADQQNPVMLLNEMRSGLKYEFVKENPNAPSQRFVMKVDVDEETFEGSGPSKKAAKASVARLVLSKLFGINFNVLNLSAGAVQNRELFIFPPDVANKIATSVNETFNEIMANNTDYAKWKVLAGIAMTMDEDMEDVKMISVSTGTKHLNGEYMSMNGTAINDCHAEVISRRCLKDFFYTQLEMHSSGEGNSSIFVKNTNGKFELHPHIKFHLFISTSPCGDARIFSVHQNEEAESIDLHPNRRARGLLRTKIESGEGTIPVKEGQGVQTWDGILQGQQRYLTMSCSDKVMAWNVLGLQGSLLSHFLEPVYLHSIVIGRLFHPDHMYRALCGRVKDNLGDLPSPYNFKCPKMTSTPSMESRLLTKSPGFSINWTTGLQKPEIVIAKTGKLDSGQVSRLAKRSFFQRFANLYKTFSDNYSGNMESHAYSEMKNAVTGYQNTKEELYRAFSASNLGMWVKKPAEQDEFEIYI